MIGSEIIAQLPYTDPFLFVDDLEHISENGIKGTYTFKASASFYEGHFKNMPVTPGVILTECCAQIGVVSLGIYLLKDITIKNMQVALVQSNMEFFEPVLPGEKVSVVSEKIYYRFSKLKCKVRMYNDHNIMVCSGELSGMIKNTKNEY